MNLLVPAALAFALIIPVILLLYFMRPKRQQRTVASTLLWQQALQDMQASRPWQRLRFTPLLLLQILAAIFIVSILVRPAIFTNSSISGNTIIILQASASMQATDISPNRFESARNDIANMIATLGPNDHISLITMANTPQVLIAESNDKMQLSAALQRAKVTNQDADLELALSLANSLATGHTDTQILVVGDGHVATVNQNLLVPFPVHYLRIGTDAPNAAILTLSSRTVQGNLTALAQIANYSPQQRSIPVELFADGREVSVHTITLAPQATGTIQWADLLSTTRYLHAQLISQDAMTVDHNAWAIVGGSQKGRALLVTNGNMFLQTAFALQSNMSLFKTTPAQYTNTGNYDLTIFDGFVPPALPSGGLLFVNPPPGLYPFGSSGPLLKVSRISPGDDKMNLLASVDLSSIHTLQISHQLKLAPDFQSVIDTPETPLLIAGEHNNQRIAALGFDLHFSDLGLQPSFPILIQNFTNWFLPQPVAGDGQVRVGSPVTVQAWPGTDQVTITGPDHQTTTVGPPFPVIPFARTDSIGIYQVTQRVHGQFLQGAFTVNLFDPVQSKLAPARTLPVLRSSDFTSSGNGATRELREIWPWLAALLLLILCAEWWIFSRSYQVQKSAHQKQVFTEQRVFSDKRLSSPIIKYTRLITLQKRYILARKQFLKAIRHTRNKRL